LGGGSCDSLIDFYKNLASVITSPNRPHMQNLVTIDSKGAWLRMRKIRRLQTSPLDRPMTLIAQMKRPDAGHIAYMFSIEIFTIYPFLCPNFKKFALRPMGTSKRYNSILVKDNCALFAPTPYFQAQAIRRCHLEILKH